MIRLVDNEATTKWSKLIQTLDGGTSNTTNSTYSVGFSIIQDKVNHFLLYIDRCNTIFRMLYL